MDNAIHKVRFTCQPFKEWWGKRPYRGYYVSSRPGTNKFFKRQLHKVERQEGINDIKKQLIQPDIDEDIAFDLMIWD